MEDARSFGFLCFGLAFFVFTIWLVLHQSNKEYDRMLNERREFGYGKGTKYHLFRNKNDPED